MADRGIVFQYRDGNAHNCDASNLVAVRYNDFVKQGYITGRRKKNNPFFLQSKKVNQYAMDGQFIATFPSAVEASAKTGIPRPYINRAAWTDKQSAGGYYWRYGKAVKRIPV